MAATNGEEEQGYPRLAALMGTGAACILRRFAALNARNLLYLQAELIELEIELKVLTEDDARSGDPLRCLYSTQATTLRKSEGTLECDQWHKFLEIREKLNEYSRTSKTLPCCSELYIDKS